MCHYSPGPFQSQVLLRCANFRRFDAAFVTFGQSSRGGTGHSTQCPTEHWLAVAAVSQAADCCSCVAEIAVLKPRIEEIDGPRVCGVK